jgi:serine protease AprX
MKLSPRRFVVVFALALAIANVVPAAAQSRSKLDRFLREARSRGTSAQHVIIQAHPGREAAVRKALQARGIGIAAEHPGLSAVTVTLSAKDLAALEAEPSVKVMSADAEVVAFAAKSAAAKAKSEPVDALRETLGLSGLLLTGAGIKVAVIDSGIDPNKDLAGNIQGFWDFTRDGIATRPFDDYGHGTHVAGLIASTGFESHKEFAGIAPAASLYGFKVLDDKGRGRASDVVRALEFITFNKLSASPSALKIDIINLSLGHPVYEPAATDPLVRAVERAVRAGIVVITAAGNVGSTQDGQTAYTGITSPGNSPSAVTVGAVDTNETATLADDVVAAFSSRGPTWFDGFAKPDVVAPGVGLMSDVPRFSSLFDSYPQLKRSSKSGKGSFGKLSGTSMAAAVTSGAAALVMQASRLTNPAGPALSAHALKGVLQFTAIPLQDPQGQPYDALTQGTGELNVRGAVTLALAINTSMPAASAWLRFQPEPQTEIAGAVHTWSQALLWDDNIVWGTEALAFNSAQWDDNIVWGTALGDDNIVWGTAADVDNIVWGTAITWATDLVWPDRVIGLMSDDNIVWGTAAGLSEDNIVWGTVVDDDNIVWGTWDGDNLVWGTSSADNLVWGTVSGDNLVWGTSRVSADNLVWGTAVASRR